MRAGKKKNIFYKYMYIVIIFTYVMINAL